MYGLQGFTRAHATGLAVVGSVLMFIGWALAIVPTFRDLAHTWPIVLIALLAFAVVLIPSGADFFNRAGQVGEKRGPVPLIISALPAAVLYVVTVAVLPLGMGIRVLVIVVELVGLALFLMGWGSRANVTHNA